MDSTDRLAWGDVFYRWLQRKKAHVNLFKAEFILTMLYCLTSMLNAIYPLRPNVQKWKIDAL